MWFQSEHPERLVDVYACIATFCLQTYIGSKSLFRHFARVHRELVAAGAAQHEPESRKDGLRSALDCLSSASS